MAPVRGSLLPLLRECGSLLASSEPMNGISGWFVSDQPIEVADLCCLYMAKIGHASIVRQPQKQDSHLKVVESAPMRCENCHRPYQYDQGKLFEFQMRPWSWGYRHVPQQRI